MTSGIEAFYETREKNLSVDLSVDLSVECGYYDELYMDVLVEPCSVVTNMLLLKRYGTPVRNIMWIKARYNQNTSIG